MSDFLLILVIFLIVAAGVGTSVYFIRRELRGKKEEDLALSFLKQDIEALKKSFGDGFSQVVQELGRVQEIGHTLRDFQDFLRSPKLRGGVGEQVLKDLISQSLCSELSNSSSLSSSRIVSVAAPSGMTYILLFFPADLSAVLSASLTVLAVFSLNMLVTYESGITETSIMLTLESCFVR